VLFSGPERYEGASAESECSQAVADAFLSLWCNSANGLAQLFESHPLIGPYVVEIVVDRLSPGFSSGHTWSFPFAEAGFLSFFEIVCQHYDEGVVAGRTGKWRSIDRAKKRSVRQSLASVPGVFPSGRQRVL
jgi:hypothetical protein